MALQLPCPAEDGSAASCRLTVCVGQNVAEFTFDVDHHLYLSVGHGPSHRELCHVLVPLLLLLLLLA